MTMQKGRDLILKMGDGADTETFEILAAARTVGFNLNNEAVDITSINSKGFQELQVAGGVQALDISVEGIFKDSDAEENIRVAAFGRTVNNYQLSFPNGDVIEAAFVITQYKRDGSYNGLETFSLSLMSSGEYSFTKGE